MRKKDKNIIPYLLILPPKLDVKIHRVQDRMWAQVKNLPGCVTQADSFTELIEMINDAVFTYFEIPEKYRVGLGFYLPELPKKVQDHLAERIKHKKIEDHISRAVRNVNQLEFSRTGA